MNVKEILNKNEFRFNKRFGQNFITDGNLLDKIVELSGVDDSSVVLEIGMGAGTLSSSIAKKVKKLYGYEIDGNLKPVLSETLSEFSNVDIAYKDFMKENLSCVESRIGEKYTVVANLPYYITTPILMRFIEEGNNVERIVVMIQEEVADRLCAKENTEEYGAITAAIDAVGDCQKVLKVGRQNFYPMPNVDSAVVRIDINREKYQIASRTGYRRLVRSAFAMRRKTLANNLMQEYKIDRATAEEYLTSCGIDVKARGETLTTEKLVELANFIDKKVEPRR